VRDAIGQMMRVTMKTQGNHHQRKGRRHGRGERTPPHRAAAIVVGGADAKPKRFCFARVHRFCLLAALLWQNIVPAVGSRIDLPRPPDLLFGILDHFLPLGHPTDRSGEGKKGGKHVGREAQGF
jgi:hypothetical protein